MKRSKAGLRQSSLELDRRGFLRGAGVAVGALPLQAFTGTAANAAGVTESATSAGRQRGAGRRAIHQDLPYIDHDGLGTPYDAPRGNQATRDYVNSLTQEEFLRRHWFS